MPPLQRGMAQEKFVLTSVPWVLLAQWPLLVSQLQSDSSSLNLGVFR